MMIMMVMVMVMMQTLLLLQLLVEPVKKGHKNQSRRWQLAVVWCVGLLPLPPHPAHRGGGKERREFDLEEDEGSQIHPFKKHVAWRVGLPPSIQTSGSSETPATGTQAATGSGSAADSPAVREKRKELKLLKISLSACAAAPLRVCLHLHCTQVYSSLISRAVKWAAVKAPQSHLKKNTAASFYK